MYGSEYRSEKFEESWSRLLDIGVPPSAAAASMQTQAITMWRDYWNDFRVALADCNEALKRAAAEEIAFDDPKWQMLVAMRDAHNSLYELHEKAFAEFKKVGLELSAKLKEIE